MNIQRNYRGISSSDLTSKSGISSFSTSYRTSSDSNQINNQKVSIFFIDDNNTQRIITSNGTRLTVAIYDLIMYEGLYLNLSVFGNKCVKSLPTPKQKAYIKVSSGYNSLSEHTKELAFGFKRVKYFRTDIYI